ncbi:MAG: thermonuclease family protein [Patescibacteria group bacterium]
MKKKSVVLFSLIVILLAVILIINKRTESEKPALSADRLKVTGDKRAEEETGIENKNTIEATTTNGNIQYLVSNISNESSAENENYKENKVDKKQYYLVTKVVDGDTIDVLTGTTTERVRLIGINTPETVDPRKLVECFGKEASAKAHELLENKKVYLEVDETQDNRDKYKRLLRYAFREDGVFYNLEIIKQGYAYEYTYQIPYKYQMEFKAAQVYAKENKLGLWADNACAAVNGAKIATSTAGALPPNSNCNIKGNINSKGEKIYHLPACAYYAKTIINLSQGEKYFCTESEAIAAGWRKAQNCK